MTENAQSPQPVLEYRILSTDSSSLTAEVEFLNPRYTGEYIVTEEYASGTDEDAEMLTREVDNDPFPHVKKTVRVPVKDGKVDQEAFLQILHDQSMGVKSRMDTIFEQKTKKPIDLDKAFGL